MHRHTIPERAAGDKERTRLAVKRHRIGRVGLELHSIRPACRRRRDELLRATEIAAMVRGHLRDRENAVQVAVDLVLLSVQRLGADEFIAVVEKRLDRDAVRDLRHPHNLGQTRAYERRAEEPRRKPLPAPRRQ